jgi:FixJ family two-component response regulator
MSSDQDSKHPSPTLSDCDVFPLLESRFSILVIDDDRFFRDVLQKVGVIMGLNVETMASAGEFDPFSNLHSYDGVIIDYYLGGQCGGDLMKQLPIFFSRMPTLLVSADPSVAAIIERQLMGSRCEFVPKAAGAMGIIRKIVAMIIHQSRRLQS